MGAWMALTAHPCIAQRQLVDVDIFVPLFESTGGRVGAESALEHAYASAPLGSLSSLRHPTFLRQIETLAVRVDDLRLKMTSEWGEELTQQAALRMTGLAISLPVSADCKTWTKPTVWPEARTQILEVPLEAHDPWCTSIANISAAQYVHRFVRIMAAGPTPRWVPLIIPTWDQPLGVDCELKGVVISHYYTLHHPRAELVGPGVLHAVGRFVLSDGAVVEMGVQLDKQQGLLEPEHPVNTGAYIAALETTVNALAAVEVYLRIDAAAGKEQVHSTLPPSLQHLEIRSFYACLAEQTIRFEGPPGTAFAHRLCTPGLHLLSHGTAWGAACEIRADAGLARPAQAKFSLQPLVIQASLLNPADFSEPLRRGIVQAVSTAGHLFVPSLSVARAVVHAHVDGAGLGAELLNSTSMVLSIEAQSQYRDFHVSMLVELDLTSAPTDAMSNTPKSLLADQIASHWPRGVGSLIRAENGTSLHAFAEMLQMLYPEAAGPMRPLPEAFKVIRLPTASGCFAMREHAGYCDAGIYAAQPLNRSNGVLNANADVHVISHTLS